MRELGFRIWSKEIGMATGLQRVSTGVRTRSKVGFTEIEMMMERAGRK